MENNNKLETEERVLKIIKNCINGFNSKFLNLNINPNQIEIKRNGENDSYFSEIEIEFWKSTNLIDALSIIIFLQGKLVIKENEINGWLENEMLKILKSE